MWVDHFNIVKSLDILIDTINSMHRSFGSESHENGGKTMVNDLLMHSSRSIPNTMNIPTCIRL